MFKALSFKRKSRERTGRSGNQRDVNVLIVDLSSNEQPTFDIDEGENFLLVKAGKRDLKTIKMAMRQLENKTHDPNKYDPVIDAQEIELIQKVDERVRIVYDIVSAGGND